MARGSKPGERRGGRKKGTLNKKTQDVLDKLASANCDPILGMVEVADRAKQEGDWPLAGQMYKELAQYVAPKRKAVEHTGADGGPMAVTVEGEIKTILADIDGKTKGVS